MKIYQEQKFKNVVYFANFKNGLVKVGTTSHLKNRLRALRHQCGFEEIEFFCIEGSYITELLIKKIFKKYNTFGEWFKKDYRIIKEIIKKINIPKEKQDDKHYEDKPKKDFKLFSVSNTFMIFDVIERYLQDCINSVFYKEKYRDFEKNIKELLDFNKELGEEEYLEVLEDVELIDDSYDLFSYVERIGFDSYYNFDFIMKKYFNGDIKYLDLIKECLDAINELIKNQPKEEEEKECFCIIKFECFDNLERKINKFINFVNAEEKTDKEIYQELKKYLEGQD